MINPNNRIESPYAAIEPPLWAGILATHYRNLGREVSIVDAEALDLTPEQTAKEVMKLKPHIAMIVVMGNNPSVSSTPKMGVTKKLVDLLKDQTEVSVTGLHPSALPDETEKELGVYVVSGKVFDGLPPVSWDLLPNYMYRAHNWHCLGGIKRHPYASIYTSLGCPYSCEFCNIHALYGDEHKIMYRSPDEVIKEIGLLVKDYGVRNIKFWDELFTFNPDHVHSICEPLIRKDFGLNIWAYARVDSVKPELLKTMKNAGINWLAYGFEAGSNKVLNNSNKHATRDEAKQAVAWTHEAGINVMGNFIFGLSGDTPETMQATLDFAKCLNIEYANFYEMKAYPGSKIYAEQNKNWADYDQYKPFKSEANDFRDKAFADYFTDPKYLRHVQKRFGTKTVADIMKMVKAGKPQSRG